MNNYWVTNFNADQRGTHSWTYYLTTSADVSNGFASRFGWGCRVPFLSRILPGSGEGDNKSAGSFITGWPSNVILITAQPEADGKSFIIQIRETNGQNTQLNLTNGLNGKVLQTNEVDATGNPVINSTPDIGPLESRFYRIVL
jgi:alpha-mannosidase